MTKTPDHAKRAHALLSASSAHRWLNCPPSAVASELYPRETSEYAAEGTKAHEVAETMVRLKTGADAETKPIDAPAEMVEHAVNYADYILEHIKGDDAVLLLEQRVDLSPWVPGGFGTCDCIVLQGTTMDVIDYKYGKGVAVDAVANEQLMLYGLGALNDYGIAYDVETVRLHIYQPRINNVSVWAITAADLLAWGEQVKPIAETAAKGEGEYLAGDWCRFCPHAGQCKTLTATCTEFVETHDLRVAVPVLAPHEVADVLRLEPLVTLWLKRVKSHALAAMLDGKEVPGYKVVEGKLGNRKWTDELAVLDVLTGQGYDRADVTETKLLSPAAMDKAVGRKKAAELLADYIDRAPGAPTIVPESDKRPVYDPTGDFDKLD